MLGAMSDVDWHAVVGNHAHRPYALPQRPWVMCTVQPPSLALTGPPLLHFARRLDVVGWALERC